VAAQVEQTLDEARRHIDARRWSDALAAARRAEAVLHGISGLSTLDRAALEIRQDVTFVLALLSVRDQQSAVDIETSRFRLDAAPQQYIAAFNSYGVDVYATSTSDAAHRISSRPREVCEEVLSALCEWRWREMISQRKAQSQVNPATAEQLTWLEELADSIESDRWRKELLNASWRLDRKKLLKLANDHEAAFQPTWALTLLGRALLSTAKPDEGLAVLRSAQHQDPSDFWLNAGLYDSLNEVPFADPTEKLRFATASVVLRPKNAGARLNLGNALANAGRLNDAIAEYRMAMELEPDYHLVRCDLGGALMDAGRLDEAIIELRTAIEMMPGDCRAYNNLGLALLQQGRLGEALDKSQTAVQLGPDDAICRSNLANVLMQKGDVDEALRHAEIAVRLDPQLLEARHNLGHTLIMKARFDEAIVQLKTAIQLGPKAYQPHGSMGLALAAKRQFAGAVSHYETAIRLEARAPDNLNNFAWLLATCVDPSFRNPARAMELATRATELAAENGGYWNTLGTASYRAGDWSGSVAALRRSMTLRGGGGAHDFFFLAMAHWQLGNKDEAADWYERAVAWMEANLPDDEELRRFRAEAEETLGIAPALPVREDLLAR